MLSRQERLYLANLKLFPARREFPYLPGGAPLLQCRGSGLGEGRHPIPTGKTRPAPILVGEAAQAQGK